MTREEIQAKVMDLQQKAQARQNAVLSSDPQYTYLSGQIQAWTEIAKSMNGVTEEEVLKAMERVPEDQEA